MLAHVMSLTPSDVDSLSKRLFYWELAEYFFAALVTFACLGEFAADFTKLFTEGVKERKERLAKGSTLLLISALALELVCLVKTNSLSGQLVGSLSEKAGEADNRARTALTNSATALAQANSAEASSGKAENSASNASTLARGARQEADSFEKDIVSAKTQASAAEAHLSEALKRADEATAEVTRIKSPRTLANTSEMVTALGAFKGTEYVFVSVFHDPEAVNLVKAIDDVLQKSGWKRGKSVGGFPAINIYGSDKPDFSVPSGFATGIEVLVDSPEPLSSLQALSVDKLPTLVKAALTLNLSIASCLNPPEQQSERRPVNVQNGTSSTIRIAVGKKS